MLIWYIVLKVLALIIPLLIAVAYLTLAERKILALMQRRKGPNVVGLYGLLQPVADGIKLLTKERVVPIKADKLTYTLAPGISLFLALLAWGVIPLGDEAVVGDLDLSLLFIMAVSSLGVYAVLISGWASRSRYALLGALRAVAQMISYEVSIGLLLLPVILCSGSLNLTLIVMSQRDGIAYIVPLFPVAILFMISVLAETGRAPFDLPEGESELVSGYNVEYSGIRFALLFLAEYTHVIMVSCLFAILFLGGWNAPFNVGPHGVAWLAGKTVLVLFITVWTRASLPRIRYDQLMRLVWKAYLPTAIGMVFLTSGMLLATNGFPNLWDPYFFWGRPLP